MSIPDPKDYGLMEMGYDDPRWDEAEGRYRRAMRAYHDNLDRAERLVRTLVECERLDLDIMSLALQREHRTNQQKAARAIRTMLAAMAVQEYDDRNEAMVRMGQAASAAVDGIYLPYI